MLERDEAGKWFIDGKEIVEQQAINELAEAVQDLGYWCQVAKDVPPAKRRFTTLRRFWQKNSQFSQR